MQDTPLRRRLERNLVNWCACGWVASWNGVIKYHGPKPVPKRNHIWVANHSSMIDYTVLTAYMPFAAIMQLQPGWVGFLQQRVLSCLGCLWFHRTEVLLSCTSLAVALLRMLPCVAPEVIAPLQCRSPSDLLEHLAGPTIPAPRN